MCRPTVKIIQWTTSLREIPLELAVKMCNLCESTHWPVLIQSPPPYPLPQERREKSIACAIPAANGGVVGQGEGWWLYTQSESVRVRVLRGRVVGRGKGW